MKMCDECIFSDPEECDCHQAIEEYFSEEET